MAIDSSLTQKAYLRLRQDLLACRLAPGEKLNIQELSQQLSVSLGAVREALSRLTSEGFVVTDAPRGFRAAPISAADLLDLTRTRTLIEGQCLRRAIEVGDVAWEARIAAAHRRVSRTPQLAPDDPKRLNDDFADAHDAFHEALASACDSPWLLRMRALLYAQSERYRYLAIPLGREGRDHAREHDAIIKAAFARDADKAVDMLVRHLEATTRILLETKVIGGGAAREEAGPRSTEPAVKAAVRRF
jgi:DNA-binding GntR family transcriptional regulator